MEVKTNNIQILIPIWNVNVPTQIRYTVTIPFLKIKQFSPFKTFPNLEDISSFHRLT